MNLIFEIIALSSIWFVFWTYWVISAIYTRRNAKGQSSGEGNGRMRVHVIVVMAAIFLTFSRFEGIAFWNRIAPSNIVLEWAGIIVAALALSFSVWARQTLRNNWSGKIRKVEGQKLIFSGHTSGLGIPCIRGSYPVSSAVLSQWARYLPW